MKNITKNLLQMISAIIILLGALTIVVDVHTIRNEITKIEQIQYAKHQILNYPTLRNIEVQCERIDSLMAVR